MYLPLFNIDIRNQNIQKIVTMTIMIAKIIQKTFQMLNTIDVFNPFFSVVGFYPSPKELFLS